MEMPSAISLLVPPTEASWSLPTFAGRFAEISGEHSSAALSLVFRLVQDAQKRGEPVAWIGREEFTFFPPDVAAAGVDLAALPFVRVKDLLGLVRAAELLLRSGAFGLVVLDFGEDSSLALAAQSRLATLAQKHHTALVGITEKGSARPSLGSLVSLRAHTERRPHHDESARRQPGRFVCEAYALKDKRRGPDWKHVEERRGVDGLC